MTSRERLTAAARGGETDRKAVISYPGFSPSSDAVVVARTDDLAAHVGGDRAVLLEVSNPFFRLGPGLSKQFRTDPETAASRLDEATDNARREMATGLESGADGIFYRLHGARALLSTPMEYGGIFLERDRELLSEVADAPLNVLFLVGNDDLYVDFVSDLPAHVIAWDQDASGFTGEYVRSLRTGAQASSDPGSEIDLNHLGIRIADQLDRF